MNSRQLQYVITLAETKSFSEAAEKLMVSQPSLSQLISKLEDEIGVQLFERTVPLTITYAGEVYVNTAKKILSEEAEMQDTMAYLRGDNAGKLKIATGYLNAVAVLPELIAGFQRSHPNVQIEIFEDIEPNLKPLVDSGKVDLVLATSQFDSAGYEKVLIGEEQYLFAIPKSFGTFGGSDIEKIQTIRMTGRLGRSMLPCLKIYQLSDCNKIHTSEDWWIVYMRFITSSPGARSNVRRQ